MIFDSVYFLFLAPALLLAMWAQSRVQSNYRRGMQIPTRMNGAQAARLILDEAGLQDVPVEMTGGFLSDHYDPRNKVLRLSQEVYHSRSATAVGIAAHEAGHALQDATNYLPLIVRNAAVPAATFGPMASMILMLIGFLMGSMQLIWLGIIAYGGICFFQLVNLPVEFDASNRAKRLLTEMGIVSDSEGAGAVKGVLNAAALTYVAATLQSVLTLLYFIFRFTGSSSRE